MNNTILKSLGIKNFASFADGAEFTTMTEAGKKENPGNFFEQGDFAFNKVSFLYGANGSGKTFFCKILREIQRILDWSPLSVMSNNSQFLSLPGFKGMDASVRTFAFDEDYRDKPTDFMIEIILDGTKKRRRTEKLIERTSSSYKDINLFSELKNFEGTKYVVKESALCLPVAALLNNPLAMKIVNAIKGITVVSMTAARLNPAESEASFSEERINKYVRILKKADPTLRDMKVSFEQEEVSRQKFDDDDFENRELIATKTTVGVETEHAVYKNGEETRTEPILFFTDESLGTVKLFTALPYLFDVLESGGVLVIDELENGLHLSLAKEIVDLFISEESNPNHAQLICTSHQPLLLDGNFRRDQVWIATKDEYGKSTLRRLSEKKTSRAKVNLTRQILEGAFGCNPDLFFNDNT